MRPKLGEREVTFLHVTEWIEKKLQHEFQVPVLLKGSASPLGSSNRQTSVWVRVISTESQHLIWSIQLQTVKKRDLSNQL